MCLTDRRTRMWKNTGRLLTNTTTTVGIVRKVTVSHKSQFCISLFLRASCQESRCCSSEFSVPRVNQEHSFSFARPSDADSVRDSQRNTLALLISGLILCSFASNVCNVSSGRQQACQFDQQQELHFTKATEIQKNLEPASRSNSGLQLQE